LKSTFSLSGFYSIAIQAKMQLEATGLYHFLGSFLSDDIELVVERNP